MITLTNPPIPKAAKRTNRPAPTTDIGYRIRFNTVIAAVSDAYIRELVVISHFASTDDRLLLLWKRTQSVGEDVRELTNSPGDELEELFQANLTTALVALAAHVFAWLSPAPGGTRRAMRQVWSERERQRELFREKKISFDVAGPIIDPRRKFRVLAEEVGEVAHALDQIENHGMASGNLHMELIQVAAVAVAWLESMEVQS